MPFSDEEQARIKAAEIGIQYAHHMLLLTMRENGHLPFKIRTTVYQFRDDGTVLTHETENAVDAELYEESYQQYLKADVLRAAKDVIEEEEKK